MIHLWQYTLDTTQGDLTQINFKYPAKSLDELTDQLPTGVYTTFRTFHKFYVLNLPSHIQRLEQSAWLKSRPVKLDEEIFRRNLRTVLKAHPADENRVRAVVTLDDFPGGETVYLSVEELRVPADYFYRTGVTVKTVQLKRINPEAKATEFITQTRKLRSEITNGINEILMVDENGFILEGLSSNFFAVQNKSVLTTSEGILPGITRELVLDIIRGAQIPLIFHGIHLDEIPGLQESFITSTSRGVLPVVKIDETLIGSGQPGQITQKLMKDYLKTVEELIAPI